jgi:hypothetical protein
MPHGNAMAGARHSLTIAASMIATPFLGQVDNLTISGGALAGSTNKQLA